MAGFEELGLQTILIDNAREAGFDAPSALQRSVIPVLRRGGNAIIHASSGSGITAAYALALLDRFNSADGTRALVIVPTTARAERVAGTIARLAAGTNARVAALASTWPRDAHATIIVAAAEKLLTALEESQIKLEQIDAVVAAGASAAIKLAGEQAFATIFASLPTEGQRIFISSELSDTVKRFAEAHARKALHFPPRPAVEGPAPPSAPTGTLRYIVATPQNKTDQVARFARAHGKPLTLLCRNAATARAAERDLRGRGFDVDAVTYDQFERAGGQGEVIAYDVPFSGDQVSDKLRAGDLLVAERDELAHIKSLAAEAHLQLEAATLPPYEADSLNAFRNEIRRAAREEDLEAQLLVLEPLFNELSVEEIAAAAVALLRSRRPARPEAGTAKPGVKTWSRLFLSIGERDGVRAADVVGAITGESGIRGDEVGKIEIRDTFSVVEVASTAADRVIKALNGTTMKNRALRVDYDRKTASGPARRSAAPAGKRRPPRAPTRRDR